MKLICIPTKATVHAKLVSLILFKWIVRALISSFKVHLTNYPFETKGLFTWTRGNELTRGKPLPRADELPWPLVWNIAVQFKRQIVVHMNFLLPRVNHDSRVTRSSVPGDPPHHGNILSYEQSAGNHLGKPGKFAFNFSNSLFTLRKPCQISLGIVSGIRNSRLRLPLDNVLFAPGPYFWPGSTFPRVEVTHVNRWRELSRVIHIPGSTFCPGFMWTGP